MKTSIQQLSLVLLLYVPAVYSMKNNAIVSTNTESFTMSGVPVFQDNLKEIFRYSCPDNAQIRDAAKTIGTFKSVCTYWFNTLNPEAIHELFNCKDRDIVKMLYKITTCYEPETDGIFGYVCQRWNLNPYKIDQILHANVVVIDENFFHDLFNYNNHNYYCFKFLADTLKNNPALYAGITSSAISRNKLSYLKILLENGANPNSGCPVQQKTFLNMAMGNMKVFQLLLHHGGTIYHGSDKSPIMETALTKATTGDKDNTMINLILQETGHCHPHYQTQIDALLASKGQRAVLLICLAVMTILSCNTCTLF